MNKINYTIIIPHKNTPELLQKCLNSIPIREDLQVIVVDDNSDTDKVNFLHFPQWKGKNYEYYLTKEGKGAGYARNIGIKHALGEWLIFSDADDVFFTATLNTLLDLPKQEYDIIYWPILVTNYDGKDEILYLSTFGKQNQFDMSLLGKNRIEKNYIKDVEARVFLPTQKMIKRDIIKKHKIKFSEVPSCNDILFSVKAQSKCTNAGVFSDIIYHYIKRTGTTSDVINIKRLKQRTRELLKVQNFLLHFNKHQYIEYTLKWHFDILREHTISSAILYGFLQMFMVSPRMGYSTIKRILLTE